MRLERLAAAGFRNLAPFDLSLDPRAVVVRGPNAQGKTNFLEALYVCATGRSFRGATSAELLAYDADVGSLRCTLSRQDVRHDIEVELTRDRRSMRVDGRNLASTSRLLTIVNVVAFFPDDLRIAKGSPEERRRFLDRAVGNYQPDFVEAAQAYAKALKARNALLKQGRAPGGIDRELLSVYDEQLVKHGALVQARRTAALAKLVPVAQRCFREIMGSALEIEFTLTQGFDGDDSAPYAEGFVLALQRALTKDRALKQTTVGPHRADVRMLLEGHDARTMASQGQQRAMVLALKLAEVETLAHELTSPPILLLDDVSSELDAERTQQLFRTVEGLGCQLFVSTTGAVPLPVREGAQWLSVSEGRLSTLA